MDWVSNLLIGCALKKESKALQEKLGSHHSVMVTGLGTDRTLASLEKVFDSRKPSLLIFTGMAGQLAPEIELGDFVFPAVWRFETGTEYRVPKELMDALRKKGWSVEGIGITVRKPVVRSVQRLRLHRDSGAQICDMECAAAMMIAETYGVPCLAPKVVSDTGKSGMLAFYRHFRTNMETLAARIVKLISCLEEMSTPG